MKALVLSGGGAKGAYQLGVLTKWMGEDRRDYDMLCGVSVGALNCAVLSTTLLGQPFNAHKKLEAFWKGVTTAKVRKDWPVFGAAAALWKPSVYDSSPLAAWAYKSLSPALIRASGRTLVVGAVCWETGEYHVADQTSDDIVSWVLASASYPALLSPVKIGGKLWTDGGVREITPLGEAIRRGATEIDVIVTAPDKPAVWPTNKKAAVPGFALRALDLMSAEIMDNDLKVCGLKNRLAVALGGLEYRKVTVRVMRPSSELEVDSLTFDGSAIARMVELGYNDAVRDRAVLL
jgi:NTE family protein